MFRNLKKLVEESYSEKLKETAFYIENGYFETWAEEHRTNKDRGLEDYSTPKKWDAYKSGTLDREKAVNLAIERCKKQLEKEKEKDFAKLEAVETSAELIYCNISVEWKKSSVWGYNPSVTVRTNDGVFYGSASGCGYDKESAAIASALKQSASVRKMLYTNAEKALEEGKSPESKRACTGYDWRDILGYGSGYSILPYFEGGVGVSSQGRVFENCGYTFERVGSGKRFDCYTVTKKEG